MAAIKYIEHPDFHWTPLHVGFSIFLGVVATMALWLFTGLLIGLFML